MAALGNIGASFSMPSMFACRGLYTLRKQPTSVDVSGSGTPLAIVLLNAQPFARADVARADASGVWHFYDLDDGTYYASEVGSANAWEIVVSGSSATVTPLSSSSGGGSSFGYIS